MTGQATSPFFTTLEEAAEAPRPFESSETYKANKKYVLGKLATLQSTHRPFGLANTLSERYVIDVSKEESDFSKTHAKAYSVTDLKAPGSAFIGYVVDPHYPHRESVLQKLRDQHHPHLVDLVDAGVVHIEPWQSNRFVVVYVRPMGVSLASLLESGQYYKPSEVMKRIVVPIAAVLHKLSALGINHGGINPQNIFVSQTGIMLGECIAEPAGSSQPLSYEPIEHLQAMPEARGNGTIASDMYALAMLTLDATGELGSRKQLTRSQLIAALLTRGSYNFFVNESNFSVQVIDFFRAVLLENASERWNTEQLILCAGGKRYNLIPPTMPRDSNRPHHYDNTDYYSLRALAQAFCNDSEKAMANIREVKLLKWLETMSYRPEVSAAMEKVCSRARRMSISSAQRYEMVARATSALDPQSPIRYKDISAHPDHFSLLILHALMKGNHALISTFQEMMQADMITYWRDLDPAHANRLEWEPEVIRIVSKYTSVGFGSERLMYEMNPSLPCMSNAYLPYYAMNAKALLLVLDSDAAGGKEPPLHDRHLMAFIAARAHIRKEVKIAEFRDYPELYQSRTLQSLVILARAQEKTKTTPLHGLSAHTMLHISEMVELFHSRDIRASLSRDLQMVLPKGNLAYLLRVLHNREYLANDQNGHAMAKERFSRNQFRLIELQDKRKLQHRAEEKGLYTAFFISLMILMAVSLEMMAQYSH